MLRAMTTAKELRDEADDLLYAGDHLGALHRYAALVQVQPTDIDHRLRCGDALLALGEVQHAAEIYAALAKHAAHAGRPLRALVALKILTALEPQLGSLVDGIAELYGAGSARLGPGVRMSLGDEQLELPDLQFDDPPEDLREAAKAIAVSLDAIARYPEKVPPMPLFSELPKDAFAALLRATQLVRVRPGAVILREGDAADAFFALARGSVEVTRSRGDVEIKLAALGPGAIFGETAVLSAQPRTASVRAVDDSDLLRFDRAALAAAKSEIETLSVGLDKFMRERLLRNLLKTSPFFAPLTAKQRFDLIKRFTAHDIAQGTHIIEEGSAGQGLFVLLSGQATVWKRDGAERVALASLSPGDVFGEISLLQDAPTSATVTASTNGTVLFLGREYFQALVSAVDEIRDYVENLLVERMMDTRMTMDSISVEPLSDDDLIMI